MDPELQSAKERRWREVNEIDAAYARGELDDPGWHRALAELVVPAYLAAPTVEGGSGSTRDAAGWEYARSLLVDAVQRPGTTFLDIGCANGLLMESMARWADAEPYGLDIAPELVEVARSRLPHWADRIWVGNALEWRPPQRFDVIRTALEYVPERRRRNLLEHLLAYCDRLVVGVFNEERGRRDQETLVDSWGFTITGRSERPHPHPALAYRAFWIDAA